MQSSSMKPAKPKQSVHVDLGTDRRSRHYRIPLSHKILIANSAIVAVGAILGTIITVRYVLGITAG